MRSASGVASAGATRPQKPQASTIVLISPRQTPTPPVIALRQSGPAVLGPAASKIFHEGRPSAGMICILCRRAGGDVGAKAQRIADIAHRFEAAAGAAHDHGAVTEDAAEQRLV